MNARHFCARYDIYGAIQSSKSGLQRNIVRYICIYNRLMRLPRLDDGTMKSVDNQWRVSLPFVTHHSEIRR